MGLNHPIDGLILKAENVTIDCMNSDATPPHVAPALIQPTPHRVSVRLLMVVGVVFLILAITLGVLAVQFNWLSRLAPSVASLSDGGPQSLIMHDTPICMPTVASVGTTGSANKSPFGLAWFHKPPQDGTTAGQLAAQSSYIHLTGAADIPFRDQLRSTGYKGRILTYTGMNSIEGPGPYAMAHSPAMRITPRMTTSLPSSRAISVPISMGTSRGPAQWCWAEAGGRLFSVGPHYVYDEPGRPRVARLRHAEAYVY